MHNSLHAMKKGVRDLETLARTIRATVLKNIAGAGGGHTGGSLSSADILVALYFHTLKIDPLRPDWAERDRFILSKGHSVESYHAVLAERGFFDKEVLDSYGKFNSILAGHPTRKVPGIEINSGALGHGLSVGVGLALAAKRSGAGYATYVLTGDGEHGEGTLMEAAAAAGHYQLDNLVCIVDRNGFQISGPTEEVMAIEQLEQKYQACGWAVRSCRGHDMQELLETFECTPFETGRPSLIIARTTKGKGVSFMENRAGWHHRVPSQEELRKALEELDQP